jgi:hypothetical protein
MVAGGPLQSTPGAGCLCIITLWACRHCPGCAARAASPASRFGRMAARSTNTAIRILSTNMEMPVGGTPTGASRAAAAPHTCMWGSQCGSRKSEAESTSFMCTKSYGLTVAPILLCICPGIPDFYANQAECNVTLVNRGPKGSDCTGTHKGHTARLTLLSRGAKEGSEALLEIVHSALLLSSLDRFVGPACEVSVASPARGR